jgi:TPR repeat protein
MCLIKGKYNKDGQKKEEIEKGFSILNQIANDSQNPSPEAMAELGEIYEYGNFNCDPNRLFTIKKDMNKAISYFTKARNMKLPRASNNLGVLYLNTKMEDQQSAKSEINAEQDKKILQYLNEAQEQGFSQAYYNLGIVYSKGLAGQKNS